MLRSSSHQQGSYYMVWPENGPPPPVVLPEPPAQSFTWSEYIAMCVMVCMVSLSTFSSATQIASKVIIQLGHWLTLVIKKAMLMEASEITSKESPVVCHSPTWLSEARRQDLNMSANQKLGGAPGNVVSNVCCAQSCSSEAVRLQPARDRCAHLRNRPDRVEECNVCTVNRRCQRSSVAPPALSDA
jgi:hypothetical protein